MIRTLSLLGLTLCAAVGGEFKARPWNDYQTILWMGGSPWKDPQREEQVFKRLQEMGINAGMVTGDEKPSRYVNRKMPYYVENMVNKGLCLKWSSNVKDWNGFVTNWTKSGRKADAFVREYCFDDPAWRTWARGKMTEAVKAQVAHAPLLYDIRDELSTTISANPFDFDFHPLALAQFRKWLQQRYASLEALNQQWETKFRTWDEVVPFSTDQIKNRQGGGGALPRGNPEWSAVAATKFDLATAFKDRTRWNFAPWCDHRTYMDQSLATVLDELRQTAHQIDSSTPVGIEGTQMPHAFGGYDLWRLSQVLDWIEPYDICNSRDILGSFMPGKTFVTTVGEQDANAASRRLWHLLLEGDRGCIIWWSEDSMDFNAPDYPLTAKARALSGVLKEMTSPLAKPYLHAERQYDNVVVLYSQPSIQVGWLMESTVDGSTWVRRFSSYESQHNRMAQVRDGWWKGVQDLGLTPRFISTEQFTTTWKPKPGGVLILPQCVALSDAEITAIRAAKAAGTIVLMNPGTGAFDEHGTLRTEAPFGNEGFGTEDTRDYAQQRLKPDGNKAFLKKLRESIPLTAPVKTPEHGHLRVYRHELGAAQLISVERGISYSMSEALTQAGGNESMEKPLEAELTVPKGFCYDLRTNKKIGQGAIRLTIEPWLPSLLAVFPTEVADARKALESALPK